MSFTDEDGNKCACSRNRQCALHRAEAKKRARVAEEIHASTKVRVGIEELRARYAVPQPAPRRHESTPRPRTGRNGWAK